MKPKSILRNYLCIASSTLLAISYAHAANYYWDSDGSTAGLGDTAGTWGTSAFVVTISAPMSRSTLRGTVAGANTVTAVADLIYFGTVNLALGSTASTVTVGTVSMGNIVFGAGQSNPVTLTGGTITLAAAGSATVNNSSNTISSVLAGAATSFTKGGVGTLNLTGANSYTGTTIVGGGGMLTIGDGTTGSLNGTTGTALTFNNGGGNLNVAEANASTQGMGALTFSAGDGKVTSTAASGAATQTLTFASLAARAAGATGNFSLATNTTPADNKIVLSLTTNAPLDNAGSNDAGYFFGGSEYARYDTTNGYFRAVTYGTDTNAPAIVATGTTLGIDDATNDVKTSGDITAQTTASVNTLNLASNSLTLQDASQILSVNGILATGGAIATAGTIQPTSAGGEMVFNVASGTLSVAPNIQDNTSASPVTKSGAGTLTLSGANIYTGTTRINAGILAVSGGSAIVDTGAVVLANAASATLQLDNNETILNVTGGGFSGGNVNVQGNTLTLADAASQTFGGTFTGTTGGIIKQGVGTLTLSNKNTFAGSLTLEGGALEFTYGNNGTGAIIALSSGGAIDMANGTTLRFNPTSNLPAGIIGAQLQAANGGSPAYPYGWTVANHINIASGTSTANIRVGGNENCVRFTGNVTGGASGDQTLAIFAGGIAVGAGDRQPNVFSGTIANAGVGTLGVNVDFAGASGTAQNVFVCLSGQNTFTGPIVVTNSKGLTGVGTGGGYLGIGGEIHSSGPTFVPGTGYLGTSGNYTNTIALATGTKLTYLSSANQTLGGEISGGGALLKLGAGTLTLSVANIYSGTTTVSAGTLLVNNTTGSGTGSGNVTVTAGTLGGTGSISGTVTIGNSSGSADAILAPGNSIDSIDTGNLSFLSDGRYAVELDGTSVTTDVTNVTGTVSINATTTLSLNVTGTLSASQQYVIVSNDGADAVTGTFSTLVQDAVVGNFGGTDLKISYTGGDGNDIVLYTDASGSAYDTWKAANAPGSNPDDDTDGDGVTNAVEFVLGGTSATNDLDKLPTVAANGTDMTFTFVRDETSVEASTVVTIEVSNDLVTWNAGSSPYAVPDADTAGPVNPGVTVVDNGATHTVTLTIPQAPDTMKFARLKVVITP